MRPTTLKEYFFIDNLSRKGTGSGLIIFPVRNGGIVGSPLPFFIFRRS